jgi:RNA polymerase sigma factor (sigma-70 family)
MPLTPEQSQMVEDNIRLAYFAFSKYHEHFDYLDPDDILSACFIGLCKAVQGYNPELGTTLGTYATKTMYRTIIRELIPRKQVIEPTYLEDIVNKEGVTFWQDIVGTAESMDDEVVYKMLGEQAMAALDNIKMGKAYKVIIKTHYHEPDLTQMEIAERVGCRQKTVSLAYGEARKKLRPMVCMG